MAKSKVNFPSSTKDLNPAAYNPRTITDTALDGLKYSLDSFGDISGIVYNLRTNSLVCGHQRIKALPKDSEIKIIAEKTDAKGTVAIGYIESNGTKYLVRFVDWDEQTEKAANVAGNNPKIQGDFTEDIKALLDEIQANDAEMFAGLKMDEMSRDLKISIDKLSGIKIDDSVDFTNKISKEDDILKISVYAPENIIQEIYDTILKMREKHPSLVIKKEYGL